MTTYRLSCAIIFCIGQSFVRFFHPLRIAYVSNRVTLVLQLNSQIPDISKHELGYRARIVEIVEFHSLGRTSCFSTRCRCCLCCFKWRHRYTQSSKVPLVCTGAFLFACLLFCLRFFLSFFLSIRLKSVLCWCNNWKSHSTESIMHKGAKLHKVYTKIVKLQLEPYDFPSFVLMTTSSKQRSKHIIRTTKEFKFGWTPKKRLRSKNVRFEARYTHSI